jgi:protein-disulfide isomerase
LKSLHPSRALAALTVVLVAAAGCKKTASAPSAPEPASAAKATGEVPARQARIIDTLKFKNSNIAQANPVIGEIKPSPFSGLEEGTLTVTPPQAPPQSLKFYITADDKALFLAEPIDASHTVKELRVERDALFAKLTAGLPVRGKADAPVTLVEFSDFQCPYCQVAYHSVMATLQRHPADVRFIYKQFPLSEIHPWASAAAQVSSCAARQNPAAFWKLHDAYFERQRDITPQNFLPISRAAVAGEKLDDAKLQDCISNTDSPEFKAVQAALAASLKEGESLGVHGTPSFFINGRSVNLTTPEMIDKLIEDAKAGKD